MRFGFAIVVTVGIVAVGVSDRIVTLDIIGTIQGVHDPDDIGGTFEHFVFVIGAFVVVDITWAPCRTGGTCTFLHEDEIFTVTSIGLRNHGAGEDGRLLPGVGTDDFFVVLIRLDVDDCWWHVTGIVMGPCDVQESDLPEIGHALSRLSSNASLGQSGQQDGNEKADDRDDHYQLG